MGEVKEVRESKGKVDRFSEVVEIVKEGGDIFGLYSKLLDIQKQNLALLKDATNPHFKNKYSSLNGDYAIIKPILSEKNMLLYFSTTQELNVTNMHLNLVDVDNKCSLQCSIAVDMTKGPQQAGSQFTYYKRYMLEGLFALPITDDTDNDGEEIKEWLNLGSPDFNRLKEAIGAKKVTSLSQVYERYKISDKVKVELVNLGLK